MYVEIHCLCVDQRGSKDLKVVLCSLKGSVCGLGGVWDPNSCPLRALGDTLVEGVCDLLYP